MAKRGSIFEADDDNDELDVSGFEPKAALEPKESVEQVRAIAEASNFRSREAKPAPTSAAAPVAEVVAPPVETTAPAAKAEGSAKRQPRRHRTGRTMQLNVRTTPEAVEAFYAIADKKGWLVGETIEQALAALQRELGQGS